MTDVSRPSDRFGMIEEVGLGSAWTHEEHDFTPWLAENLRQLSAVTGLELELVDREVAVGPFWADILARNIKDDSMVLIENQLEFGDHRHLGQILTYLAGLNAKTVIWIAAGFKPPHLSAIKWLNEHTMEDISFFAIRLKVVRIGNSPLAPVFEVLERPNEWEKRLSAMAAESESMSEIGEFRQAFWTYFLSRYPEEEKHGPAGATSNRWNALDRLGLVNSIWVGKKQVGYFVRGERGVSDEAVEERLTPFAERLQKEFGDLVPRRRLDVDMTDRSNWARAADWLHKEAQGVHALFKELTGGISNVSS